MVAGNRRTFVAMFSEQVRPFRPSPFCVSTYQRIVSPGHAGNKRIPAAQAG